MIKSGTSYRTTIFAILAVLPQVLPMIFPRIPQGICTAMSIIFAAAGLTQAKDYNVTGGTIVNANSDATVVASTNTTTVAGGVTAEPAK